MKTNFRETKWFAHLVIFWHRTACRRLPGWVIGFIFGFAVAWLLGVAIDE